MKLFCLMSLFLLSLSNTVRADWQYDLKKDEMRRTEKRLARLESLNEVKVGQVTVKVVIALVQGDAIGAFITTVPSLPFAACTEKCFISVRFGDEEITDFEVIHFKDTLQVKDFDVFSKKLTEHDFLIFEVFFGNNIARQFKFNLGKPDQNDKCNTNCRLKI